VAGYAGVRAGIGLFTSRDSRIAKAWKKSSFIREVTNTTRTPLTRPRNGYWLAPERVSRKTSNEFQTKNHKGEQMGTKVAVCGATLALGDDFGDNQITFHCQLPLGHEGEHVETSTPKQCQAVRVSWTLDERGET